MSTFNSHWLSYTTSISILQNTCLFSALSANSGDGSGYGSDYGSGYGDSGYDGSDSYYTHEDDESRINIIHFSAGFNALATFFDIHGEMFDHFQMTMDFFPFYVYMFFFPVSPTRFYRICSTAVSYKKQDMFILREHLGSLPFGFLSLCL